MILIYRGCKGSGMRVENKTVSGSVGMKQMLTHPYVPGMSEGWRFFCHEDAKAQGLAQRWDALFLALPSRLSVLVA